LVFAAPSGFPSIARDRAMDQLQGGIGLRAPTGPNGGVGVIPVVRL
jgi:hypothetical protein